MRKNEKGEDKPQNIESNEENEFEREEPEKEDKRYPKAHLNVVISKDKDLLHWQEVRIPGKLPERRSYMASCTSNGKYSKVIIFSRYKISTICFATRIYGRRIQKV